MSSGKHQQQFGSGDKSLGAKVVWQWIIGASLSELQGSDVYYDFVEACVWSVYAAPLITHMRQPYNLAQVCTEYVQSKWCGAASSKVSSPTLAQDEK